MNTEQWFILFLLAVIVVFTSLSVLRIGTLKKKINKYDFMEKQFLMSKPELTYDECKEIIDTCFAETWTNTELNYEVNEVSHIRNLDKEVGAITAEVIQAISTNVLTQMECYVSRSQVIKYISRNVKYALMGYLKKKN